MDMTIVESMTRDEAELCLAAIEAHFNNAADLARDFDTRLGWRTLGYDSLKACLVDRFDRHGYRLWRLHEVRQNLVLSPTGQNVDPSDLRERHVRDSGITDLPAPQQIEAYTIAKELAASEDRPLNAGHVTKAVAQVKTKSTVFQSNYLIITHMVVAGDITPEIGHQFVKALDALKPKFRGHIVQLMGRFGLTCPALVMPIAGMFDREIGKESYVLPEVLTGFLGGVPLKQATATDLEKANEEARLRHIADELEKQRQANPDVVPEIITVYKGDPRRTLAALRTALGNEVYNLRDLLMEE